MPGEISKNTLFCGDNLTILREYMPVQSVELITLDPSFNSNRSYDVLFREVAKVQITAFGTCCTVSPQR